MLHAANYLSLCSISSISKGLGHIPSLPVGRKRKFGALRACFALLWNRLSSREDRSRTGFRYTAATAYCRASYGEIRRRRVLGNPPIWTDLSWPNCRLLSVLPSTPCICVGLPLVGNGRKATEREKKGRGTTRKKTRDNYGVIFGGLLKFFFSLFPHHLAPVTWVRQCDKRDTIWYEYEHE